MNKYLVTFEFRYSDEPDSNDLICKNKVITVGVFDDIESACSAGNKELEKFEARFELNSNYNIKRRFNSQLDGTIISNLAYILTPFTFYGKIETLRYLDIDNTINEVMSAVERYKAYVSLEENSK